MTDNWFPPSLTAEETDKRMLSDQVGPAWCVVHHLPGDGEWTMVAVFAAVEAGGGAYTPKGQWRIQRHAVDGSVEDGAARRGEVPLARSVTSDLVNAQRAAEKAAWTWAGKELGVTTSRGVPCPDE